MGGSGDTDHSDCFLLLYRQMMQPMIVTPTMRRVVPPEPTMM